MRSFLLGLFLTILLPALGYGAEDWCIQDPSNPPCRGAPGRCTLNRRSNSFGFSEGGFVATTAHVESIVGRRGTVMNIPYIGQDAQICDSASITGQARIVDWARVSGTAWVGDRAQVSGDAEVSENAWVYGSARVSGESMIAGHAQVFENAQVSDRAIIEGRVRLYGNARIREGASLSENAQVYGNAQVSGHGSVSGNAHLFGNARVFGEGDVEGYLLIGGDAVIDTSINHEQVILQVLHQGGLRVFAHGQIQLNPTLLAAAQECLTQFQSEQIQAESQANICPICYESWSEQLVQGVVHTSCRHFFCRSCLSRAFRQDRRCPLCRREPSGYGSRLIRLE